MTSVGVTLTTVPLTTSPSAMLRKLLSYNIQQASKFLWIDIFAILR